MSENFQPGDMVEVINVVPMSGFKRVNPFPPKGEVYTVRRVRRAPVSWAGYSTVSLVIDHPNIAAWTTRSHFAGEELGWSAHRFRKLLRPDPQFLTRLLAEPVFPAPKRVREDA